MTKNILVTVLLFLYSLNAVLSQEVTVADPNVPGGSIVEISTLDVNGLPTLSIVESIPPGAPAAGLPTPTSSSTTSSSTTSLTTPPVQAPPVPAGPVGAPPPTTVPVGEGTTLFTFTTVVDGATEILTGTFTPTYNSLPLPPSPTSGTILGLSEFNTQFGTAAISNAQSSQRLRFSRSTVATILTILCGITAGVLFTM